MNKKKKKSLVKIFQKEILLWDIKDQTEHKKGRHCQDFGTRSCLTCNKCWEKNSKIGFKLN